jgi:hypothetical protein
MKMKKERLAHGVLLRVLVAMKNDKHEFRQILKKHASQYGLPCMNMLGFQAK